MKILTRSNVYEEINFNRIKERLVALAKRFKLTRVDPDKLTQQVVSHIYDGITTYELDEHSARISASWGTEHPEYLIYAAIISVDNLHKDTEANFSNTMFKIQEKCGNLKEDFIDFIKENTQFIEETIDYSRDFVFDYIGFQTLNRSYLLKLADGTNCERPQHLYMRVAIRIHQGNLENIKKTYDLLSLGYYTHATPTLFNAGTINEQLASCFLLGSEDSIEGIFKTFSDCALISKGAGGIGVHIHDIRASGTRIKSTNGKSNGIVPMVQVYNSVARYVDQGGGKRKGSIAIYLEPWHADIRDFLELKKNSGDENMKARDIFLALWVSDLFMERVRDNGLWSLMCPFECPGLSDTFGDEFVKLYESYEREGKYRKQVNARDLFKQIMESQIETGVPYICYKDSVNRKSNQKNLGVIKSSNLCSEIMEYSSNSEYAVCNLASINLKKFVENNKYNFEKLRQVSYEIVQNLDRVIDLTNYPTVETEKSNSRNRPIGLGVQGLADVFYLLKIPFDSTEALQLNEKIFESIYYGAVESSCDLATELGSYSTFQGSYFSEGKLQLDLWDNSPNVMPDDYPKYDWSSLRQRATKGMRNSLLTAIMPTASTSQIMGNYECIEPPTSNIFIRKTLAGHFTIINKYLVEDLDKLGLWNEDMKDKIIFYDGSIQKILEIPESVRNIYKTVWEIPQKVLIDLAADRSKFIDQSQSLNLFLDKPDFQRLYNCHMYGWKKGLKTGMYYLRTKPAVSPIKFSLGTKFISDNKEENECLVCSA